MDDFLIEVESTVLETLICSLYMGCHTVADELLFMSSSDGELQLMFNLA